MDNLGLFIKETTHSIRNGHCMDADILISFVLGRIAQGSGVINIQGGLMGLKH